MLLADIVNPSIDSSVGNSASTSFLGAGPATTRLISALINFIFIAGTLSFVFMFLIGGFQWITSGGDKEGVAKARNRILHALVGLIILLSTFAFLSLLSGFFGFDLLKFTIPSFGASTTTTSCVPSCSGGAGCGKFGGDQMACEDFGCTYNGCP